MSNFTERKAFGDTLENRFKNHLTSKNFPFLESGIEKSFKESPDYYQELYDCTDEWAMLERYRPDILSMHKGRMVWFEIKKSKMVERHCYETAMIRHKRGEIVWFVFNSLETDNMVCVEVQNIKWEIPNDKNNFKGIPVEDVVWRNPRKVTDKWTKSDVEKWKSYGSGTAFAVVDFDETVFKII